MELLIIYLIWGIIDAVILFKKKFKNIIKKLKISMKKCGYPRYLSYIYRVNNKKQ